MLNDFKKARTVTGLMLEVVKMTEDGRQLLHTYQNEPTYNSLTALADFAQAEYVKKSTADEVKQEAWAGGGD